MILLGIENLLISPPKMLAGKRLGLLCNQASTDRNFTHSRDLIRQKFPGQLRCLFSPQHGFFSEKQDNMIESDHSTDPVSGLPVFSLYGESRRPDNKMFDLFDVLLVDLIDVGTRVYTFIYTLAYCMEVAAKCSKPVVILDRPNPIGGECVEGNILQPEWASFVGLFPLPMRHGLTIGELAGFINSHAAIGAELSVVPMQGWQRRMYFEDTGQPWVFPSPNMPSAATALVYPGQVLWEGTNISEGRGTTLPFELFGAPFIDHGTFLAALAEKALAGCCLRPVVFQPTSNKWQEKACEGFHLHVVDKRGYKPYLSSLFFLQAIQHCWPDDFAYKEPPYEYEYEKLPLDLILGDQQLRLAVANGDDLMELEQGWQNELDAFKSMRQKYFIYP